MPLQADVCVIGGGPGGYVAALRAAALDAQVVVVENSGLGGVCLNRGCIPSKALLRSAEVFQLAKKASSFGVRVKGVEADYKAMVRRKDRVVRQLGRGIEGTPEGRKRHGATGHRPPGGCRRRGGLAGRPHRADHG